MRVFSTRKGQQDIVAGCQKHRTFIHIDFSVAVGKMVGLGKWKSSLIHCNWEIGPNIHWFMRQQFSSHESRPLEKASTPPPLLTNECEGRCEKNGRQSGLYSSTALSIASRKIICLFGGHWHRNLLADGHERANEGGHMPIKNRTFFKHFLTDDQTGETRNTLKSCLN